MADESYIKNITTEFPTRESLDYEEALRILFPPTPVQDQLGGVESVFLGIPEELRLPLDIVADTVGDVAYTAEGVANMDFQQILEGLAFSAIPFVPASVRKAGPVSELLNFLSPITKEKALRKVEAPGRAVRVLEEIPTYDLPKEILERAKFERFKK